MFSVSPTAVLNTRKIISETNQSLLQPLLLNILALETSAEVRAFLEERGVYENIL